LWRFAVWGPWAPPLRGGTFPPTPPDDPAAPGPTRGNRVGGRETPAAKRRSRGYRRVTRKRRSQDHLGQLRNAPREGTWTLRPSTRSGRFPGGPAFHSGDLAQRPNWTAHRAITRGLRSLTATTPLGLIHLVLVGGVGGRFLSSQHLCHGLQALRRGRATTARQRGDEAAEQTRPISDDADLAHFDHEAEQIKSQSLRDVEHDTIRSRRSHPGTPSRRAGVSTLYPLGAVHTRPRGCT